MIAHLAMVLMHMGEIEKFEASARGEENVFVVSPNDIELEIIFILMELFNC